MVFVKPNLLPDKGNKDIKHQIALLNIQSEPFFVDIIPEADAEYGDCFPNVERKVQREGGSAVYGWQFAEYAYMIEAEFHAIWQSPEGKIIDITPSADPEAKQILFVIDSNKKY